MTLTLAPNHASTNLLELLSRLRSADTICTSEAVALAVAECLSRLGMDGLRRNLHEVATTEESSQPAGVYPCGSRANY